MTFISNTKRVQHGDNNWAGCHPASVTWAYMVPDKKNRKAGMEQLAVNDG